MFDVGAISEGGGVTTETQFGQEACDESADCAPTRPVWAWGGQARVSAGPSTQWVQVRHHHARRRSQPSSHLHNRETQPWSCKDNVIARWLTWHTLMTICCCCCCYCCCIRFAFTQRRWWRECISCRRKASHTSTWSPSTWWGPTLPPITSHCSLTWLLSITFNGSPPHFLHVLSTHFVAISLTTILLFQRSISLIITSLF